jgi:6-phospho-beta-glucosidase
VDALVAGVNHCTWTTKLFYNGRDIYAELDDILKRIKIEPVGYEDINQGEFNWIDANAIRLYKYYGILPGSTYYARDYYTLTDYKQRLATAGHEHRSQFLRRIAAEKRELINGQLKAGKCRIAPLDQEDAAHGDQAIGVMNAIATDSRMLETVNVRNNGAVPFLPEDAVVEVGAVLTSVGALPIAAGNLPVGVQAVVKGAHDFGKLVVDASFQKDRRLVLQAAMAHPAHRDIDTMEKIIAEMFEAHKKWIGF